MRRKQPKPLKDLSKRKIKDLIDFILASDSMIKSKIGGVDLRRTVYQIMEKYRYQLRREIQDQFIWENPDPRFKGILDDLDEIIREVTEQEQRAAEFRHRIDSGNGDTIAEMIKKRLNAHGVTQTSPSGHSK